MATCFWLETCDEWAGQQAGRDSRQAGTGHVYARLWKEVALSLSPTYLCEGGSPALTAPFRQHTGSVP